MAFQVMGVSAELIGNQAGVSLANNETPSEYSNISIGFAFAEGHYSKRQLLEKAKRLLDEASTFLKAEISRAP